MGQTTRRHSVAQPSTKDPFWSLVATARTLQGPGGCPWDQAQTADSLLPHLIEETWEVFTAHRSRQRRHLEEELGDVLYTVLFMTLLAEREGWFDLTTLLARTRQKMIRRHPHVFGRQKAQTAEEAYARWQAVKRRERGRQSSSKRLRSLLVSLLELIRTSRSPERRVQQLLEELARADGRPSGRPRRSSARLASILSRSSGPGSHPAGAD